MPRILVVDDDRKIVRLVRSYLERENHQVLTAFDGQTAMQVIRHDRPDLVVLDLMLPDLDGIEITRRVRSDPHLAATPIIMLTARVDDTDKIVGLEMGADDYITKPFNPREVAARVRAVLRRSGGGSPPGQVLQYQQLSLDLERHQVTLTGRPVELTPTEFELLAVMLETPGRVFTRSELIERGLGYDYEGPERTIDTHIKNLRKKLEADPGRPVYVQTVYGIGYRLGDGR